jgi:hypothetical protein
MYRDRNIHTLRQRIHITHWIMHICILNGTYIHWAFCVHRWTYTTTPAPRDSRSLKGFSNELIGGSMLAYKIPPTWRPKEVVLHVSICARFVYWSACDASSFVYEWQCFWYVNVSTRFFFFFVISMHAYAYIQPFTCMDMHLNNWIFILIMHSSIHACAHTCMHTYIHTNIHTHIHTYTHIYTCTRRYTHMHTQVLSNEESLCSILPDMRTYIHVHIYTYIHTYTRPGIIQRKVLRRILHDTHSYIHTCTHTRTHAHAHTHTHTHTYDIICTPRYYPNEKSLYSILPDMQRYIHTCTHTYIIMHAQVLSDIYIYIYIHTHTHTHR